MLVLSAPAALASNACWERAAIESGTTVQLLQAIARTESSMNPKAVNATHVHITGTRDIGLTGVNTAPKVLRRLGVSETDLFDPCTNVRAGARILKEKFERHGTTWEAVGAYNASCTRLKGRACQRARAAYAWRVYRAMRQPGRDAGAVHTRPAPRMAAKSAEPPVLFVSLR